MRCLRFRETLGGVCLIAGILLTGCPVDDRPLRKTPAGTGGAHDPPSPDAGDGNLGQAGDSGVPGAGGSDSHGGGAVVAGGGNSAGFSGHTSTGGRSSNGAAGRTNTCACGGASNRPTSCPNLDGNQVPDCDETIVQN
ncbi:MAG TPA: hypothetical protein VIM73_07590, partial [Polyangiaceae bacterium]